MTNLQRKLKLISLTGVCLSLNLPFALSQEHIVHKPEQKWLQLAEEQYRQGHFQLSVQSADRYLAGTSGTATGRTHTDRERARYFKTLALLKLDAKGAEDSAGKLLRETANPVYSQRLSFTLAQYYFRNEELSKAIPYYESASIDNLSNQEIADSKFELAYAYFNRREFEKAAPLFASIREVPGKYYVAGNYYYGLLAYNEGKYDEALNSFKRIDNEPQYRNIVPYYIAEIYYFKGDRKKALEEAIRLTRRPEKLYYNNELHLLAAQVLFEEQRYGEALPYFEHYYEHTDKIRKEELYEMGYSYYRVHEWKNAIEKFKPLSNAQDSLGQTAMYLLGDCYLKTGDKKSARNAFGICAGMPFNQGQQESALLLFGKLSYDLGYDQDAIRSFRSIVVDFPSSTYASESRTYLADLLVKTGQYSEAWDLLTGVRQQQGEYWRIWQKVNYGYATEQLQHNNPAFADTLLGLSLQQPVDRSYEAAAHFWRGEIAYRQHLNNEALLHLRQYLKLAENNPGLATISPAATVANAYLNMGFAAMNLQDYSTAQTYFSRSRQSLEPNSVLAVAASVREADAAFMQKNYREALSLYDKAIASNTGESDYARLQKSILLGVQGRQTEKHTLLQQILNKTPASPYEAEARYELANSYLEDEKYTQAIAALEPLTTSDRARDYGARAWLKIGFAQQQLNTPAKAIDAYRKIVTDYPASAERVLALEALRSLYIETNQPEAYTRMLSEANLPTPDAEVMDSTYYATAEAQIAAGRWSQAKEALNAYLERYPNGQFTIRAHYYKAESHYQLKETEAALRAYDSLLAKPWNEFSEASAKRAAELSYQAGEYAEASRYYGMLRNSAVSGENLQSAYTGLLRSNYNNSQFDLAANYADTLLSLPGVSEVAMQEVQFYKARSLQRAGRKGEALTLFDSLRDAKNQPIAAEARYRIGEIYYEEGKLKEAEAAAASSLKLNAGNEYWVVKSYLLIADILMKQKDYFNSKATLQSVIRNTKNTALKEEARLKLAEVKKLEQQQSKLKGD